ncbi:hypothetical protein GDO78_011867 [Eleutherodactylus coqui]|uniref:Uncharacterized protein n=1 Tax=Eleutherodactylus coqui TaxID=57060 RepID=A0A8J6F1P3_ELECQ|nr:hypothetical protein GDO78_011867 [Eleutherodactylus coqui]
MTMARYSLYHNANFQSFVRVDYQLKSAKEKYDEIRVEAQLQHIHEARTKEKSATVYHGEYRRKALDENCQSLMRPSSPTRMNKPHPPEVFLVTTLHNIPGHYNSKKKISAEGKGKVKTRAASSTSRPKIGQYADKSQIHIFKDADSNMAAQAWLKLANDKDYSAVMKMIKFVSDNPATKEDTNAENTRYQVLKQYTKPEYVPSAQQWLLNARPEEIKAVARLLRTLSTGPRTGDLEKTYGIDSPVYRPQRKEYLIHPDWRAQS